MDQEPDQNPGRGCYGRGSGEETCRTRKKTCRKRNARTLLHSICRGSVVNEIDVGKGTVEVKKRRQELVTLFKDQVRVEHKNGA